MPGSKKTETTQATKDPWAPAQPLLNDILGQARSLGGDVSNFTPTYSDATRQGVQGVADVANAGLASQGANQHLATGTGQSYDAGLAQLMQTANGGMLGGGGGNPYLDQVLSTARQRAADAVNAQFSGAGRYGSGAHTAVLGDRLGALEMEARMNNYNTERQNQLGAANTLHSAGLNQGQFAGALDNANLQQQQLLLQSGGLQDQMDAAVRQAPLQATQWQAGLGVPIAGLGGQTNGTTTTTTPANIPGMIAGGAMAGLGLATGNPMMMMGGLGSATGAGFGGGSGQQPMAGSGQPFFGLLNQSGGSYFSPQTAGRFAGGY